MQTDPERGCHSTDELGPRRSIQDVSLQISVTNCVPLRGYTIRDPISPTLFCKDHSVFLRLYILMAANATAICCSVVVDYYTDIMVCIMYIVYDYFNSLWPGDAIYMAT